MNKILIIGGTAGALIFPLRYGETLTEPGLGAACAERFHKLGKQLIITGRNESRLAELKQSLPGTETYQLDMTKLATIGKDVVKILEKHADVDTVWINGGIATGFDIKDFNSTEDEKIEAEITTNVASPMIIARHIIPVLIAKQTETTIMITGSGLGFAPAGSLFPTYCSTKAAVHSFCVAIRQALKQTKVNVIELVPPYTATDLNSAHRDQLKGLKPMTIQEYCDETFSVLQKSQAKDLKEVAAGSAKGRVDTWRGAVGKALVDAGMGD